MDNTNTSTLPHMQPLPSQQILKSDRFILYLRIAPET